MSGGSNEKFVSEAIEPVAGTFDTAAMARGAPGLPQRFAWRGVEYRVVELLESWKSTGPCHHGADEQYVRRHWYRVRTEPAATMTIYCDRQARDRRRPKARWW